MLAGSMAVIIGMRRYYKNNPAYDMSRKRLKFYVINVVLLIINLSVIFIFAILSFKIIPTAVCCIIFSFAVNFFINKFYRKVS